MSFQRLAKHTCIPCLGGVAPLRGADIARLLSELDNDWEVVDEHHLTKTFLFEDWTQAVAYVVRIAEIADKQGHHPDLHLSWGKVTVDVWTHKINGLTESDFYFAAKAELASDTASH